MVELLWQPPPSDVALGDNEAHVWSVDLNPSAECISELRALLSPEECDRADRFRFDKHRRRYSVSHGALRCVLGDYLRANPESLAFRFTPRGKPEFPDAAPSLHFNLSHSDDLALIAVTRRGPVGVDVERLRPVKDADQIAQRFFTARESAGLLSLPEDSRPAAFFNLWTRKEAWLKATGQGISESLNRVEVTFLPGEPARILSIEDNPQTAAEWSLTELNPATGFIGALTIAAHGLKLRCWRWG